MYIAYKYRIYPTIAQQQQLSQMFGCARYIYNYCLDLQTKEYQTTKKKLHKYELQRRITLHKSEMTWLKDTCSQSLNVETEFLESAYNNFFRAKKGFPKFKSKHDNKQSLTFPVNTRFRENKLYVPKIKTPIKIKLHRKLIGEITGSTITKTPSGKYFISINQKVDHEIPSKVPIVEKQAIGIDIGIKTFLTGSDGLVVENPKFLGTSLKRLKKLSRQHSKKVKGSNNRNKSRIKLARLHEKVANQRQDFLDNVTKKLVTGYDTICLETLSVKNMVKNHCLAQALSDIAIGSFNQKLEYKAEWYGKNILRCGRFDPSSRLCTCGVINKELTLKDRIWTCTSCNTTHDRDVLASNNIKKFCFLKYNTAACAEIYACENMSGVTHSVQES